MQATQNLGKQREGQKRVEEIPGMLAHYAEMYAKQNEKHPASG
jgi:hypothetical protein